MNFRNVTAFQAFQACDNKNLHVILDVRTPVEWSRGIAVGAKCIELSSLQQQAQSKINKNQHYYVMCEKGLRSKAAMQRLQELGFENIFHIENGFIEWQKQQLPIEIPKLDSDDIRYARHHQLKGFGKIAQDKLKQAHVVLIGAGGLGSACGYYLAAAGVGEITVIDDDVVELSNLQRQILHNTNAIGLAKVKSAQNQLIALNPQIKVNALNTRLDSNNADAFIQNADVVIDGSDNLQTRYLVNDICLKHKKPLVYSSVFEFEAQISVFDLRQVGHPCLRCLFPHTDGFEPENCTTVGVLGVVPGIAGIIQASETIKLLTDVGDILEGKLLVVNLLDNSFNTIKYKKDLNCQHG